MITSQERGKQRVQKRPGVGAVQTTTKQRRSHDKVVRAEVCEGSSALR